MENSFDIPPIPRPKLANNDYGIDRGAPYFNSEFQRKELPNINPLSADAGGYATEEDQDFNPNGPFTISVNGTTDANGVQTSPITIDCAGGSAQYPARGLGESPQIVTYSNATGISVSPPSSGVGYWRVYAEVSASLTSDGMQVSTTGTIKIEAVGTGYTPGSNTRYEHEGLGVYKFYFLIGTVAIARRSDGKYQVRINQIQVGNYTYGNVNSTTATTEAGTISTKDGLREFTICINGEPFTCHIEVSNITKVT